jgi:hypothetical protein
VQACLPAGREGTAHFLPSRPALTEPQASVMGTSFLSFTSVAPRPLVFETLINYKKNLFVFVYLLIFSLIAFF